MTQHVSPVMVWEGTLDQDLGPQRSPARGCELIDDEGSLGPLEGVHPVHPHHPRMHGRLGDDEAPHHHDGKQGKGSNSIGHNKISSKGTDGSEEANGHVVHQQQNEPVHEEPAAATSHSQARTLIQTDSCQGACSAGVVLCGGALEVLSEASHTQPCFNTNGHQR